MGYIYMLTNKVNGKSYIGQTIRPIEKRLEEHQRKGRNCSAIYNAIQKYGWDNFEKDWYKCPDDDLNFDEDLMVREMGTLSPEGYNLREGGGSTGKMSEPTRHKISEAKKGKRSHNFGIPRDKETRQKISEAKKGERSHMWRVVRSDNTKEKISKSTSGDKNYNSKKVYQYDLGGILLGTFGSCREAARHIEGDGTNISMCARGVRKTAYGFKWSYV